MWCRRYLNIKYNINVVLEKDGDDQLDQSFERRSITKSQEGEEYPA